MSLLAAMRPDDVNLPLFVHVLGAMLLVGTLLTVSAATLLGWRRTDEAESAALTRFSLRTLLLGVVPAYIVMRAGAEWTAIAADLPKEVEESTWVVIGYVTADAGVLLIVISIVLSAIGLRRLERGSTGFGRAVGIISIVLLAAYLVAVWAMSAKPD